jgi:3-oxoacyl-[acyl-carrier protein] reductase
MRSIASDAAARWGRLDALVNNAVDWVPAAEAWRGPFEACPDDHWRPLMRANSEGPFVAIQSVLPFMRQQSWGRIVNVSSVAAVDGMTGFGWYSAAKAALHGLTQTLARDLGPAGILVNVVVPGATATERVTQNLGERTLARHAAALPIRRLPDPDDVAALVVFLASAANKAITGEVVRASGGRP